METRMCIHVLLIVVSCSLTTCSMKSRTYHHTTQCTTDKPANVLSAKRGKVWCGVQCGTSSFCPFYQFKANSAQCEIFDYLPGNFTVIDQCTSQIASPTVTSGLQFEIVIVSLASSSNPHPPVLSVNSWIIIQNKVPLGSSSTSFNQPWIVYRNGFGDLTMETNYWIGNEVIYGVVSTGNYQLRVEVTYNDGTSISVIYSSFSIGPESTQYTLSVAGYIGVANGDALLTASNPNWLANGMKFSTVDRDNDQCSCNCANIVASGWWYNWCSYSSVTYDGPSNWVRVDAVESSRMAIKQF